MVFYKQVLEFHRPSKFFCQTSGCQNHWSLVLRDPLLSQKISKKCVQIARLSSQLISSLMGPELLLEKSVWLLKFRKFFLQKLYIKSVDSQWFLNSARRINVSYFFHQLPLFYGTVYNSSI